MRPYHPIEFVPGPNVAEAIQSELAKLDVRPAGREEIIEARALAARLIGPGIVDAQTLRFVHERSGAGVFVTRGDQGVTGVLALILLTSAGLRSLRAERFDVLAPDLVQVASRGEEPAAVYVWGMAASRKMAGARLSDGLLAIANRPSAHLPYFARAASPIGARLLGRTGFRAYPGSTSGLLHRDAFLSGRVAA